MSNRIRQFLSVPKGILQDHPTGVRVLFESTDLAVILVGLIAAATVVQGRLDWASIEALLRRNILLLTTAGLTFLLAASLFRLYRSWRWHSVSAEILALWKAWGVVALVLLLSAFDEQSDAASETQVLWYWLLFTPLAFAGWRLILRYVLHRLRAVGFNTRKVLVIGSGNEAVELAREIIDRKDEIGVRFLGLCDQIQSERRPAEEIGGIKFVGGFGQALDMAASRNLDIIYIALPLNRESEIRQLIDRFSDTTVTVHVLIPELFEPLLYNQTQTFGNLRTVSIFATPFEDRMNEKVKRIVDLVFGSLFLMISAVPMAMIALIIRVSSGSPVIFKQQRYGLGGRGVDVWKFRTMTVCQDGSSALQATKNDPRVTPVGVFLRKTSLDELPQLINVLQGQMSLVGPRPHPVNLNETYRKLIKFYMFRHSVKPGITGWAQVNGLRGETETLEKMEKRIEHDLFYIKNWSLMLDLRILLMTLYRGLFSKNAY